MQCEVHDTPHYSSKALRVEHDSEVTQISQAAQEHLRNSQPQPQVLDVLRSLQSLQFRVEPSWHAGSVCPKASVFSQESVQTLQQGAWT